MSKNLPELRKVSTDIAKDFVVPKKGKKKPPNVFITEDLKKKEQLTLREKFWVYNSVVLIIAGFISFLTSVAVLGIFHDAPTGLLALNLLWILMSIGVFLAGVLETQDRNRNIKTAANFQKRKDQAFAERQREKASHALERYDRFGGHEVEYDHFTTRVQSSGRTVTFTLIQHKKVGDDQYVENEMELDVNNLKLIAPNEVQELQDSHKAYEIALKQWESERKQWTLRRDRWYKENSSYWSRSEYVTQTGDKEPPRPESPVTRIASSKTITREEGQSLEQFSQQVTATKALYDRLAAALEQQSYQRGREELEVKMLALQMRN